MIDPTRERWPPVYDADDLQRVIIELATERIFDSFYWPVRDDPVVCQGDVVELTAEVPYIDASGVAVASAEALRWLVIGNTCDFARAEADVAWTQLVPLVDIGLGQDVTPSDMGALRRYRYSRRFYVPPWPELGEDRHHFADFLRPVAAEKGAFGRAAKVVSRMSFKAWVLLHSCLVRFLARDDGRFD